jgi:hypothetical protein
MVHLEAANPNRPVKVAYIAGRYSVAIVLVDRLNKEGKTTKGTGLMFTTETAEALVPVLLKVVKAAKVGKPILTQTVACTPPGDAAERKG